MESVIREISPYARGDSVSNLITQAICAKESGIPITLPVKWVIQSEYFSQELHLYFQSKPRGSREFIIRVNDFLRALENDDIFEDLELDENTSIAIKQGRLHFWINNRKKNSSSQFLIQSESYFSIPFTENSVKIIESFKNIISILSAFYI